MLAIIGAMEEEIEYFLKDIENKVEKKFNNLVFYLGKLYGQDVVITHSGIGMVSSAMATTLLIEKYNPKKLIFTGVAGALNEKLNPTDVVISTDLVEYLFDATAFGYKKGEIPRIKEYMFKSSYFISKEIKSNDFNIFYGRIVSGDKFVSNLDEKRQIGTEFEALACDMESASFAQVCYMMNKEFLVIRSISDSLRSDSYMEYNEFLQKAIKNNKYILKQILENYE